MRCPLAFVTFSFGTPHPSRVFNFVVRATFPLRGRLDINKVFAYSFKPSRKAPFYFGFPLRGGSAVGGGEVYFNICNILLKNTSSTTTHKG